MLLFNTVGSGDGIAYNMSFAITIRPRIGTDLLERAAKTLMERHDLLRSTFHRDARESFRLVDDDSAVICSRTDARGMSEDRVRSLAQDFAHRRFDLGARAPIRFLLIDRDDDAVLVIAIHHIACDLRSLDVLLDETVALLASAEQPLPAVGHQFADYAGHESPWLRSARGAAARDYWRALLDGVDPVLELPGDLARPADFRHAGGTVAVSFPGTPAGELRAVCRSRGVTPFVFLLTAYCVLLWRHSGRPEFLLGVTYDTRRRRGRSVVGPFVNTVPIRAAVSGDASFADLLELFAAQVTASMTHADYPFSRMPADLGLPRDPGRTPLVQVLMSMLTIRPENRALAALAPGTEGRLTAGGHRFERFELRQQEGQFDLGLDIFDSAHAFEGRLKFNTTVITRGAAERMARHYTAIVGAAVRDPLIRVGEVRVVDPAERATLLAFSTGTALTGSTVGSAARTGPATGT